MLVAGVVGYVLRKLNFSLASLLVGLVLGPLVEKYFVQAMLITGGDASEVFFASAISIATWALVAAVLVLTPLIAAINKRRAKRQPNDVPPVLSDTAGR
jgi:putative tricarboxylic transport membrane protein